LKDALIIGNPRANPAEETYGSGVTENGSAMFMVYLIQTNIQITTTNTFFFNQTTCLQQLLIYALYIMYSKNANILRNFKIYRNGFDVVIIWDYNWTMYFREYKYWNG